MNIRENEINKFDININNTYLIIDFDKTITTSDSSDSWVSSANPNIAGREIIEEMDKLYKKYRPIEMDYNISKEEKLKHMEYWYSKCMDLYYKYNLTEEQIQKSIQSSDIRFRKGMKELLIEMHNQKIPVIILSAGIGNTIKKFLENNNCLFNDTMYIISNFIEFDENRKVKKFNNKKMIHTLNKTIKGHLPKDFSKKIEGRKYKILIGDLIEDINMVNKNELSTTVKIGILTKEMNNEENYKIYKEKFDIVIEDSDDVGQFVLNSLFHF